MTFEKSKNCLIVLVSVNIFPYFFTGTTVKFNPGSLLGGKSKHDCDNGRAIGYYLEALLCLAPFCKMPLQITLRGITNNNQDPSVSI